MKPKRNAAFLYHDLDKDIYYKIDKRTGREVRAHKNGMTLQAFKPEVSGIDYRLRRVLVYLLRKKKTS